MKRVSAAANWEVKDSSESKMFKDFPPELIKSMHEKNLFLHIHKFAVTVDDFNKYDGLKKQMKIIQTGAFNKTTTYINAMEAYNYPFFTIMSHPEYLMLDSTQCEGKDVVCSEDTNEIALRLSHMLNKYARMNSNRVRKENNILINKGMDTSRASP